MRPMRKVPTTKDELSVLAHHFRHSVSPAIWFSTSFRSRLFLTLWKTSSHKKLKSNKLTACLTTQDRKQIHVLVRTCRDEPRIDMVWIEWSIQYYSFLFPVEWCLSAPQSRIFSSRFGIRQKSSTHSISHMCDKTATLSIFSYISDQKEP